MKWKIFPGQVTSVVSGNFRRSPLTPFESAQSALRTERRRSTDPEFLGSHPNGRPLRKFSGSAFASAFAENHRTYEAKPTIPIR
jgi:hypothetical protein